MLERQDILIVDDRPENLWALALVLQDVHANVVQASSGNEALIACLNHDFALAILDVQMPGMDGFELARLLRGDPKTAHLPIIFLSAAYADEQHVFRGYAAGGVDYVVKPYDPAILLSKVAIFLELERQRAEIARHRDHLDELVQKRTAELEEVNVDLRVSRSATLKLLEEAVKSREQTEQLNAQLHREIAERKVVEEALARARDEAEAVSRLKSQFLANMSHEIRTPMNGVIGMAGLLLDTHLSAEQRRYAEAIRSSGGSLLALLNDILDISKIEAGKLALESLDFDLRALIEDLVVPLAERAREKRIAFSMSIAPDVPSQFCGDPCRLRQILTNLIGNAFKFTESGEISVTATRIADTGAESVIRFVVRDTGIGVSPELQSKLFQKFTQADASTTRRYGGSGLGLAIARELVELMGGEIGVRSPAEGGSEFWFTARMRHSTSRSCPSPSPAVPPSMPVLRRCNARILLAEDNVVNQEVALGILRKLGLRADAVDNGAQAVAALTADDYDLVLMDLHMPEMDGVEATRVIRDPNSPVRDHDIPVVALTASILQSDRACCFDSGMNAYITKPISLPALIESLNNWLAEEAIAPVRQRGEPAAKTPLATDPVVPVFDRAGLLARLMDDEELARSIIDRFLESVPGQIETLREFLEAGDLLAIQSQAHSIKGAASNVGGERLRRAAFETEQSARAGDLPAAAGHFAELQSQFDQLKAVMH